MDPLPRQILVAAFLTVYGVAMLWAIGRDRVIASAVLIALGLGLVAGLIGATLLDWFQ